MAIEARLAGLRALVVEPRASPIDKACGEGLMPGAVTALARLGVHPTGHVLSGITYIAGDRTADHAFSDGEGLGVREPPCTRRSSTRAAELGVEFLAAKVDAVDTGRGVRHRGGRARASGSWRAMGCTRRSAVRPDSSGPARPGSSPPLRHPASLWSGALERQG